jgi:hypothetical protein
MSERELREHMHDLWDALYVRLRATSPERASQVRAHHHHHRDHQHFSVAAADITSPIVRFSLCFWRAGRFRHAAAPSPQVIAGGVAKQCEFLVIFVTIFIFQEIVLDTKTELTMEAVERWLETAETAETQGGAAASSSGRYLPTSTMEEVE